MLNAAASPSAVDTVATPTLWAVTIAAVVGFLVIDFLLTRRPHDVGMREALGWSAFYLALPLLFGIYVVTAFGGDRGLEYYAGYLVEKSLSVDNLFVFILLLGAFAVPRELRQRVLLYGIVGALVMRAVFIALGAAALAAFDWVFLVFGLVLVVTAAKILRDAVRGTDHEVDVSRLRSVRVLRRLVPVTEDYEGTRLLTRIDGRRAITPLAVVVVAVLATDLVFAVDSVPAVYGITGDPYLVFVTNAFALLGLRALYFVLEGALGKLVHLGYGLAAILAFIGVKLGLHWAHLQWPAVPEIATLPSLLVVVGILAVTTVTSLVASRRSERAQSGEEASASASR
ncbi:TerC/Alx family metal homeostasis membrane protein [Nocardioides euryhalodurans]|uniref:TerC/Alx family metal homeostasis membrane protein n=1 Tax=Nocardioides euryhalodurans TaxID=2518370 RepID=UPI001FC9E3D0|nr:TerC/Alx family metal homeostasis membrane protein [Nocardioides euryhalodurans]